MVSYYYVTSNHANVRLSFKEKHFLYILHNRIHIYNNNSGYNFILKLKYDFYRLFIYIYEIKLIFWLTQ